MNKIWLFFYPLVLLVFGVYSFSQVTPNLVLSSNAQFWQFQQTMWQLGYHNRHLSAYLFVGCVLASFLAYRLFLQRINKGLVSKKVFILHFALCVIALLPSYPALSNDIFNYLMNAKMMHEYGASPYSHAAWDFPQEPWLSFMMNIHTTTPYGYVWTGLGYVLYMLALGDLQLGMILFRLLAVASVAAIGWSIWEMSPKKKRMLLTGYFMFNPLVMLEVINNTHNDITMMAFLLVGLALYFRYKHTNQLKALVALLLGWVLSVYTKLVTVILPSVVALFYLVRKKIPWFNAADYGAWLLVVAMFADGSKRFFSWYLLWAFSLSPLSQSKFTKKVLLLFTFTGMLSYMFFISSGEYSKEQGLMRIGLLFSLPITFIVGVGLIQLKTRLLSRTHG
jgi:hypothetical protein